MSAVETRYADAKAQFAALGVDTDQALLQLGQVPLSLPCWQGDDAKGFESPDCVLSGGVQITGNFPGRARTPAELRADLEQAMAYIPGKNKVNLHAFYLENGGHFVDRDQLEPQHFAHWAQWAAALGVGLDFNPSFFCHPKDASGYTLSSPDQGLRQFWVEHGKRARAVAAYLGQATGQDCTCCIWVPDGEREKPIDTLGPRMRLAQSLDEILSAPVANSQYLVDAVESKLYGIGTESYNVGTHEFYLCYLAQHPDLCYTLDMGHFHPCENISEKLSPCLMHGQRLLLHLGRAVRWNSGHITTLDDETREIMRELVRLDALSRTYLALDYADASVNRVMALAIGGRSAKKALLEALLQPLEQLRALEQAGRRSERLALQEECKYLPYGAVWDAFCVQNEVLPGMTWIPHALDYQARVLSKR